VWEHFSLLSRFAIHSLIRALGGPHCADSSATTLFSPREFSTVQSRAQMSPRTPRHLYPNARTTPIAPIARLRQLQHTLAIYTVSILYRSRIGYIRSHINPHARLAAALLIILAFTATTYITFVASSSANTTLLVSPIDFIIGLVLVGTVIAVTLAGLMAWRTRRRWEARRLARQLHWLARPHVVEEVVWREVVFEVDVEMEEMA
jgi:hypothetical protein